MATKKSKNNNTELDYTLSQDSLEYLQINKQPFSADILTEETFYNYSALEQITDNLQHQVQFSDLVLIIEGPFGSGKTSLFRQLIHAEIENTKLLSIQAEATDTLVQLQQKMSMHLQDLGNANYLNDNLKSLQNFDQTPLIVMDNAHVLSDTTLQELLRYKDQLSHEHETILKLVLFANNGFSDTLQKITDLESNQMYVQHMPEYTEKLIPDLISHKLKISGYSGESLLTESDFNTIEKKGALTPLSIMHEAALLIEKNIAQKLNPPKPLWIKASIAVIVLIAIALPASIYLDLLDTKDIFSDDTQFIEDKQTIKEVVIPDTSEPLNKKPLTTADANATVYEEKHDEPVNQSAPAIIDEPESKEASVLSTPEAEVKPQSPDTSSTTADSTNTAPLETVETPSKDQAALPEVKTFKPIIKKTSSTRKPALVAPKEKPAAAPVKQEHPALVQLNKMGLHNTEWLKQQNSSSWTLQLLGARDPETLLSFSRQHNLNENAAWYKTWLKGKAYYVLVYGNYASRDSARASITKLPSKLRNIKPWVKSMKSVQQATK